MALIRYFKPIAKKEDQDHGLPEPRGTLTRIIPSSSIAIQFAVVTTKILPRNVVN